jgi:galactonate dehydratase
MKIESITTYAFPPRSGLVRIATDDGIAGYGEITLEGRVKTQRTLVEGLAARLTGEDPRRIEYLWRRLVTGEFYRQGPSFFSAVSGIEQALWDILGKSLGVPVYQLLGGAVRDRIRVYRGAHGRTPEECAGNALAAFGEGLTAVKVGADAYAGFLEGPEAVRRAVAPAFAVRDAIGDRMDLMVDCHGRFSPATAEQVCRALEEVHPLFVEEPCYPENTTALPRLAEKVNVPIALGERLYTRWGFRDVLERGGLAVAQPDPSHAGGISETRKIAAMAETYGVALAPHNPLSAVNLAAAIQVDAVSPNFIIQEYTHLGEGLFKRPFQIRDGSIELSQEPGLGFEVNEGALQEKADVDWDTPIGDLPDGGLAPW